MKLIDEELSLCPSDVMINDWAYDAENDCYWQINIKDFRNDGNNIFFYKAIPLTKQLLEFIGGHFSEWNECVGNPFSDEIVKVCTYYRIESFVCEVDDSCEDGLVLVSSIYGNTAYIRYFHELQHAIKLCGINNEFNLDTYEKIVEKRQKQEIE